MLLLVQPSQDEPIASTRSRRNMEDLYLDTRSCTKLRRSARIDQELRLVPAGA